MTITNDFMMREMLTKSRNYCVVILKSGPNRTQPHSDAVVWEHARRNFQLRHEGKLAVVCPVNDGSEINGIGIFTTDLEETKRVMDGDPGVKAGIFIYEVHSCRSFPGDALPQ